MCSCGDYEGLPSNFRNVSRLKFIVGATVKIGFVGRSKNMCNSCERPPGSCLAGTEMISEVSSGMTIRKGAEFRGREV